MCAPAVAAIFSSKGEVEVFSKNKTCNQKILDEFPTFGGQGRSIDLLDEQLVLLGVNKMKGKFKSRKFEYKKTDLLNVTDIRAR